MGDLTGAERALVSWARSEKAGILNLGGLSSALADPVQRDVLDELQRMRGSKLQAGVNYTSGAVWGGIEAQQMGLADELATLDEIAEELNGKVAIAKVNIDDEPGLATRFGRVIEGLSRQLRAPLHHDPLAGAYEISIAVLGRD